MAQERINISSKEGLPVGRMVAGNLYTPNTKDFDGKPLTIKTGANAGQARVNYFLGFAVKKMGETHWAYTPWGAKIWAVGNQSFPQAAQRPDFAWKIEDGDSQILNKRGRKPCDNEGWPGHWILRLSGGFAPKIYRQEAGGYVQVTEPNYIKPGYFLEASFGVEGNANQNNPGVYLNLQMVCFRAFGPEIVFGPNVEEAGFGQAPLPAGASMTPLAAAIPPPGAPPAPPVPPYAGMPQSWPAGSPGTPPAPAPIPVMPNPGFVQMPPPPNPTGNGAPSPVNGAPAPPSANAYVSNGPKMTDQAKGVSHEAYIAAGWTDAQLIANGLMTL
jgi:hypothetical protein